MIKEFNKICNNIWVMDNYKWALYCWENYRKEYGSIPLRVVHLDYHWDNLDYQGDIGVLRNIHFLNWYNLKDFPNACSDWSTSKQFIEGLDPMINLKTNLIYLKPGIDINFGDTNEQ